MAAAPSLQSAMRVLVTGASGFIGKSLCRELLARGHSVRAAVRAPAPPGNIGLQQAIIPDIAASFDRGALVEGIDTVVHLAAIAHRNASDSELHRVNVDAATRLAEAAIGTIRRFVFLSSVKVNGEDSGDGSCSETDALRPEDAYGRAKRDAELALTEVAARGGMELVVIRPPLVYGPGVRGNFLRLLRWVDSGLPLPFAAVFNRRSLIFVDNLADGIVCCVEHPDARGPILLSDAESVSTPELIARIARALGRPARLFHVSPALLRLAGALSGRHGEIRRLTRSLVIDSSRAGRLLDWRPRRTLDEGLADTANWFGSLSG